MTREELQSAVAEVLGSAWTPLRIDTIMRLADAYAVTVAGDRAADILAPVLSRYPGATLSADTP